MSKCKLFVLYGNAVYIWTTKLATIFETAILGPTAKFPVIHKKPSNSILFYMICTTLLRTLNSAMAYNYLQHLMQSAKGFEW